MVIFAGWLGPNRNNKGMQLFGIQMSQTVVETAYEETKALLMKQRALCQRAKALRCRRRRRNGCSRRAAGLGRVGQRARVGWSGVDGWVGGWAGGVGWAGAGRCTGGRVGGWVAGVGGCVGWGSR